MTKLLYFPGDPKMRPQKKEVDKTVLVSTLLK